jgi:putative phosphoesterase
MKIGLIADIHANVHALVRVLEALDAQGVSLALCAGDLVCYGAHPNKTLDLLRAYGIPSVIGNYGAAVAWDHPRASRKPSSPMTEPVKQAALNWTKQRMTAENRCYLKGLPWMLEYRLDGLRVHVLHAGPDHLDEMIGPNRPKILANLTERLPSDVIVLGHTHQAYVCTCNDTLFVNPGAVGRSLDGDTQASYAILDTRNLEVDLCGVTYDVEQATHDIESSGMPPEIAALVRHGARRIEEIVAA